MKKGFTLAEVLITLAIIGTVAALTIPSVVINYQKTQTEVQLKKVYSALSNTTNLAIAEYGPISGWDVYSHDVTVPNTSMRGSEHFAKTYLMPYLKVSKICGYSVTDICAYDGQWMNGKSLIYFKNGNLYKFMLNDGTNVALIAHNFIHTNDLKYVRAELYVDLNGPKKPNTYGKDIHRFTYDLLSADTVIGKFTTVGQGYSVETLLNNPTGYPCSKDAPTTTEYCTAAIIKNGWKIPDGYPWN